jgi:hypothetical protein
MSFWLGLAIGVYLGIGGGYTLSALAEVGLGRGWPLVWRVPGLVLFWPGLFMAAIASQR